MPNTDMWSAVAADVTRCGPQVLITNEMPFGPWLAASPNFDVALARTSVRIHEDGVQALRALKVPIIISSRPVIAGERLANEAFILEHGCFRFLHQKHFFPAEEGWFETEWFRTSKPGFEVMEIDGLRIGALLCTELMFNERARAYGKSGAHLIAVPRATGRSITPWKTAGAMAAIASGCYVVSSNRVGSSSAGPTFGGGAYSFAPDGSLLSESNEDCSIVIFELDKALAEEQKSRYPVYVDEEISLIAPSTPMTDVG